MSTKHSVRNSGHITKQTSFFCNLIQFPPHFKNFFSLVKIKFIAVNGSRQSKQQKPACLNFLILKTFAGRSVWRLHRHPLRSSGSYVLTLHICGQLESGGAPARVSLPASGLIFVIISIPSTVPATTFYIVFLSFICSDLLTGLHCVQLSLQLNTVVPGLPQCFDLSLKVRA